ncbi:aldo/keto reductase [Microvirga sp. 2YAF29]|uniref:aldo/keto reductase n=1 Tax=Microvirga sp. 2YAF29 TaxID=3233031 RepID=UPI003F9701C4
MPITHKKITLGLGLVSLGREWGVHKGQPPSADEAVALIGKAVDLGISFFDTAPAYGESERLLGRYLSTSGAERRDLTIATKAGEHWIAESATTYVDHSYDALCRSIDQSMALLGTIDILQIHKATTEAMKSNDVVRAISYAKSLGIEQFGASISSSDDLSFACGTGYFSHIQVPFNLQNTSFENSFEELSRSGVVPIINRPLAMGAVATGTTGQKINALREALQFIADRVDNGIIITGTRSYIHLAETISAFRDLS